MLQRGAIPSPRHKLAAATPHVIKGPTPARMLRHPSVLSFWLNDTEGDCVTAEEAFAKACWVPEIFITPVEVQEWANAHGVLNGAMISDVLDWMQTSGFALTFCDGPPRYLLRWPALERRLDERSDPQERNPHRPRQDRCSGRPTADGSRSASFERLGGNRVL